jgi:hypothetical protein
VNTGGLILLLLIASCGPRAFWFAVGVIFGSMG